MNLSLLAQLSLIFVLGSLGHLVAWRLRVPSILVLLALGVVFGQIGLGFIDPDHLFGPVLFPIVSLSVAIILFEGGLSLRFSDLPGVRTVIFALISIGLLITWVIATAASYYILNLDFPLALLLGAICTVSGPTVVIPLLRTLRPKPPVGEILKWEGILIDPVGALLAVLVFEAIVAGKLDQATSIILTGIYQTILIGGIIGFTTGFILAQVFRRRLIPDHLFNSFTIMLVLGSYSLADYFHHESGLLAVTLAGIVTTNFKGISLRKIIEFKEHLVLVLISSLFIVLAARIDYHELAKLNVVNSLIFLAILLFVARPLSVAASTIGSSLSAKERCFIAWLCPRGIVAAAVASLFALQLEEAGIKDAALLSSYTFIVICGTVIVYALSSGFVGATLGVTQTSPQGILFVGATNAVQQIAKLLQDLGIPVFLVDNNAVNVSSSKLAGLPTRLGNILSETLLEEIDLDGIGNLLAMTANNEANSIAALRFADHFTNEKVYQLQESRDLQPKETSKKARHLRGRYLFKNGLNLAALEELIASGWQVKATPISAEFTAKHFTEKYQGKYIALFILKQNGNLQVITSSKEPEPQSGDRFICLIAQESSKD